MKITKDSIGNIQAFSKATLITLNSSISVITQNNVFILNYKFYRQTEGVTMEPPISGLRAELKLRPFENQTKETFELKPTLLIRYVVDVFMIWDNSIQNLNEFLVNVNEIDMNI